MSTEQTLQIVSTSSEHTVKIGESLGAALRGGEVVELVSDLGGGKTTLVRGIARGFGSPDKVASPTFTLSRVYEHGQKQIQHFDFYRLADAGLTAYELHDAVGDPDVVVIVEWGEIVGSVLPKDRITVAINRTGDNERNIIFTYPKQLDYVVAGIDREVSK